jgi:hypothetical protein
MTAGYLRVLICYSSHGLLSNLNFPELDPADAGGEAATHAAAHRSLVDSFQDLRVAEPANLQNPFISSRSSTTTNPFHGKTGSSQSRSASRLQRSATPLPGRQARGSAAYQAAYGDPSPASANAGPYAAPTGGVGYHSGYGQTQPSNGPLCDPRSIRRSATTLPRQSRDASERA